MRRIAGAAVVIALVMAPQVPARADDAITPPFRFSTTGSHCRPETLAVECFFDLNSERDGYVQQATIVSSSGGPASGSGEGFSHLFHVWDLDAPASHLAFTFRLRIHEASARVEEPLGPLSKGEAAVSTHASASSPACEDCVETIVLGHTIVESSGPVESVEDGVLVVTAHLDGPIIGGPIPAGPIDLRFGFESDAFIGRRSPLGHVHPVAWVTAPSWARAESRIKASVTRIDVAVTPA